MLRILNYYGQYQGVRGRFGRLPSWARTIIGILAVPGLVLLALSILAALVSILALLLLTVPAYRLLSAVTSTGGASPDPRMEPAADPFVAAPPEPFSSPAPSPGRRHVEVKIIEP
jgi:hypothetical protein